MKNVVATIATLAVMFLGIQAVSAQSSKWDLDKPHSSINFEVSHMVISKTNGKFKNFKIDVMSDKSDFLDAKIMLEVDVTSVDTDDEKRDKHLRSADFFEVEKYPKMTFKGKKMTKVNAKKYKLMGDLTIKGVTKPITLDVEFAGTVKDPWGNTRAGFELHGTVDRRDFGITWSKTLDSGGLMVGNDVEITCHVELIKPKA